MRPLICLMIVLMGSSRFRGDPKTKPEPQLAVTLSRDAATKDATKVRLDIANRGTTTIRFVRARPARTCQKLSVF